MNSRQISRRRLLQVGAGSVLTVGSGSFLRAQQNRIVERNQPLKMDSGLVGTFVRVCHLRNLEMHLKNQELILKQLEREKQPEF